jgi:hypothetical protein
MAALLLTDLFIVSPLLLSLLEGLDWGEEIEAR